MFNDYFEVHVRVAPDLLSELLRLNPLDESGERQFKHHQWLTDDFGQPELYPHLVGVMAVMKTVTLKKPEQALGEFLRRLQRAYPKKHILRARF
ncbi:MAG: P63C domain-containing protein [Gammaproteobacteria bacterium]|nr:P63C domain-containing protein [Gammaproteobacteria bacterium]